ncbi:MAG: putative spermidine/putrescine transport system substrate-binding protein [Oleiphilaceae bacterium]|jgi:putative spermidine/putrescine transport system substrate-binding protein
MKDLGINIEFESRGSVAVLQKGSMRQKSFDIYEQWSNRINILSQAGIRSAIQDSHRL